MSNYLKHIDYINEPDRWDRWPFCPVFKKDEYDPDNWNKRIHGVIHASHPSTVKEANIFMLPRSLEEFSVLNGWGYDSVAAMVADGWEVD